ncbi:sulfate adenylyltransferase [Flavobacterium salilacus subsp. salilacus]|uniref:sulfate adenylyltransferase subunit 1 n=1 Tax=Flavobacterium TaxID=237 RepID=UPI0010752246|nr:MULTISPECIES: GTP-binding protein [Flavobacterium]KAF2519791.1 sulfate adenylyltransferase [Flavobacterium salilacus subsp. salilacus]MBE1614310.1 sulfate adenylyltransferase [Flavobacterium sp. SaA2.13]
MDLLRINTAGSVDDGKSTLIGRFLNDSNALTIEQEALIARKTKEKGLEDLDFSVITDGLIAEREQGITIDVAHIYFSSSERKFIIADSPGHVEYTRNMVTGASNSEVSIILIDARKGLLEQTYRHYFISNLLRLKTVVFCINKMDIVDYSEDVFLAIATDINKMTAQYSYKPDVYILPISSLKGDNVVIPSAAMSWYKGKTLSQILHTIKPGGQGSKNLRFDVQQVIHVQNKEFIDYRAYAGKVISGTVSVGDSITILPSGIVSEVVGIRKFTNTPASASAGESIQIQLKDDIDISRGMMLVNKKEETLLSKNITATLVWMDEKPAVLSGKYILQSGTRTSQCRLEAIKGLILPEKPDEFQDAEFLALNDIAKVRLKVATPLFLDAFDYNRLNGAFILIDALTNTTAAVGFTEE